MYVLVWCPGHCHLCLLFCLSWVFFFSSRRRHTRCALVTGVQTCALPISPRGRVFEGARRVRLGDVSPAGRLRLDAATRYLQDLSADDTADSALPDAEAWVVRRTVLEVRSFPRYLEPLALATWCSGTGSHWAERRVSMVGEGGGRVAEIGRAHV